MNRPDRGGGGLRKRVAAGTVAVIGAAAFAFFYYKYVPLVPGFQAFLAPVLAAVFLLAVSGLERGLTALVFTLPLVNNLPYFFGIYEEIPHAPTALPLILVFGLGLTVRAAFFRESEGMGGTGGDTGDHVRVGAGALPLGRPIAVFAVLVFLSGVITVFRYAGFYPFAVREFLELVVNVSGVRAGGAVMSAVFSGLSYLTGFLVFTAVWRSSGGRAFSEKLLRTMTVTAVPALVFALYQAWLAPALGNMPRWIAKGQINGTFKDPNSLAGFLAAFVPIAVGLALAARGWKGKALTLAAAALGLAAIPYAGSRSGLIGLAVGLAVFWAAAAFALARRKGAKHPWRRGVKAAIAVMAVAVVFVTAVLLVGSLDSTLSERMAWSVDVFRGDLAVDDFFNFRLTLWSTAIRMTAAFPLSGVGVGAYIVELPNFLAAEGRVRVHTDSALNYFLQIGAELGLPGIVLALWIFGGITVRMIRTVKSRAVDYAALGVVSGLAALYAVFLFHTFIGSFEVTAFFWLLAGLLFRMTEGNAEDRTGPEKTGGESQAGVVGIGTRVERTAAAEDACREGERVRTEKTGGARAGKRKRAAGAAGLVGAGLGVFLFGAVHFRNSLGPLSIEQRTADFGWVQDFGFYGRERNERGFDFRWSGKRVGLVLPDLGVPLVLPVTAMHPDIAGRPVVIRICRADRIFHPTEVLLEHVQRDKDWTEIEIPSGRGDGDVVRLLIEADRTWSPQRDLGVPDPRELGFAMGEPWYRHHKEPPAPEFTVRSETHDTERWEGPWGSLLAGNAAARLRFRFEPGVGEGKSAALVLQMRGDRAAGIWPFALIRLNGRLIGRTFVRSADWVNVVLYPEMGPGEHLLSVEFKNNFHNPRTGADRNLYLGPLTLLWLLEVSQNK
ncbi:MAG: O-antigen ligase family protein [Acidobacteriota bacterium]|nr:O-antigen ligase family protein [Acidobacteriota bacterium]